MKKIKTMAVAGGLALALAGATAGIAAAQTSSTPAPGAPAAPGGAAAAPKHHHHHRGGGMPGRVEHGEFTVHTDSGDKVEDVQAGAVTAVDAASITVKSTDGFSATYAINSGTTVRKDKKSATVSEIALNDQVRVVANKVGGTATVERIGDTGPAK